MDTYGKIKAHGNNKGITVVYVAVIIVVLLAFLGLAVDIGYMYVTKGQLQNAADSAALAGADKMKSIGTGTANPNDTTQSPARTEAITFAGKNKAATQGVAIITNNTNTLSPSNDIAVGNWNGTAFSPGTTPVNSIEVKARRTGDSPGGNVRIYLSKFLGYSSMGAAATAVAALPVKASGFIAICQDVCTSVGASSDPNNPTIFPTPLQLDRSPNGPGDHSYAWTSLLNHITSASSLSPLVCTTTPYVDVCANQIYTTQGTVSDIFKDMEGVFNDPNIDAANKEFSGSNVIAWWITVPVTKHANCNPGNQPIPLDSWGYALIRVISVCDTGGGQPCRPYQSHPCSYPHKVVIDRIACFDCATANSQPGLKSVLVK